MLAKTQGNSELKGGGNSFYKGLFRAQTGTIVQSRIFLGTFLAQMKNDY